MFGLFKVVYIFDLFSMNTRYVGIHSYLLAKYLVFKHHPLYQVAYCFSGPRSMRFLLSAKLLVFCVYIIPMAVYVQAWQSGLICGTLLGLY